jgi:hypothetical protein
MRAISTALIFLSVSPVTVLAQAFGTQPQTTTLEYKPLTFWNKIELGSTYFTNATLAKSIEVAYSFELNDLTEKVQSDELSTLARDGKIAFGIADKESNTIKAVPGDLTSVSDLKKAYPDERLVVLSQSDKLFGKTANVPVYTFRDPERAR